MYLQYRFESIHWVHRILSEDIISISDPSNSSYFSTLSKPYEYRYSTIESISQIDKVAESRNSIEMASVFLFVKKRKKKLGSFTEGHKDAKDLIMNWSIWRDSEKWRKQLLREKETHEIKTFFFLFLKIIADEFVYSVNSHDRQRKAKVEVLMELYALRWINDWKDRKLWNSLIFCSSMLFLLEI